MIDKGANPFVVGYDGDTEFNLRDLGHSSNLPSQKSVYFTTRPFEGEFKDNTSFLEPWFYQNGVFDGKFDSLIGQGASGTVISGEWCGKKAAFKFIEVRTQGNPKYATDAVKTLNESLREMTSIQSTAGLNIVSFYGHYR